MKKIKLILLTIALLLFIISCNFPISPNGSVSSKLKKIYDKPKIEDLAGTWEVDSFSYEFIKESYDIGNKKVELTLNENGTFIVKNVPDFNDLNKENKNKLFEVEGKWKLNNYKNKEWNLYINSKKNYGLTSVFYLYIKEGELIIWDFIGDPDSGNRLLFTKK
ncbi:hypothetical protein D7030_07575 [Flavobacteriaceae bacterium AU392]|nr:hypothetical protein D1817_00845 [Flavobacteriaceae bacterium]RKM84982.1 hypothetical protein D7030_07575 [Flavobacteriaceae bacterium AU392]